MQKEKLKGKKGITLIALIITIIVMLILVGVSIEIVVNSNLLNTAKSAGEQTESKYEEEKTFGDSITIDGKDYSNVGEYMSNIKFSNEYQPVEYIETTGTQYIDTGFLTTDNVKIKGKVFTSTKGREMCVAGTKGDGFELGYSTLTNRFFIYSAGFTTPITSTSSIYDTILDFTATITSEPSTELIIHNIDGGLTAKGTDKNALQKNSEIQLFRYYRAYYFIGRLYELKIYDNDALVRNFIPCYRKLDSVVGLYDLVESKFYENAGEGEFIKGNNVYTPTI